MPASGLQGDISVWENRRELIDSFQVGRSDLYASSQRGAITRTRWCWVGTIAAANPDGILYINNSQMAGAFRSGPSRRSAKHKHVFRTKFVHVGALLATTVRKQTWPASQFSLAIEWTA